MLPMGGHLTIDFQIRFPMTVTPIIALRGPRRGGPPQVLVLRPSEAQVQLGSGK